MKDFKDIEEEKLRELLKGKDNPFTIPSSYFEKLPDNIMDKINSLPDFENKAINNPFIVPDGYFENLPSEISVKITSQKSKLYTWLNNLQRPRIAIPIAFATIILLAGLFFYKQSTYTKSTQQEITADDVRNSTYMFNMDEDLFVDVLSNQNDSETDESLEQYLIDNNIDLSQIENKL